MLTTTLPSSARPQSVKIDGVSQSIRPQDGVLNLPVTPGLHRYYIHWHQTDALETWWRTPSVRLAGDSVNANIRVSMAENLWTLWLSGPRLGPAVLIWSLLLVLAVAAVLLGTATASFLPLGTFSWLALGLGPSQVSPAAILAVVSWFFLLHYRGTLGPDMRAWRFNLLQLSSSSPLGHCGWRGRCCAGCTGDGPRSQTVHCGK
ncbi:MAG: hypothetical protein HOI95_29245 [Chromatiales bacterium]|nr:hypothetical protein [Chromatiales bacterium]